MKIINYTTEQIDEAFGNTFHKRLDKLLWMKQYTDLLGDLDTIKLKLCHIEMMVGLNEKTKEEWNKKYKDLPVCNEKNNKIEDEIRCKKCGDIISANFEIDYGYAKHHLTM